MRQLTIFDKMISQVDQCIRTLDRTPAETLRPNPSDPVVNKILSKKEKALSANLMRINHTGEVCAQALYLGQALSTKTPELKAQMRHAAIEENDHLSWCQDRLNELGSHSSYLNPLWWFGSFAIGLTAGIMGDKWSLGFVMETENQVSKHLSNHLNILPKGDHKSRAIVAQMEWDEQQHATLARQNGAVPLPAPIPLIMACSSKVMTTIVYYV